jgi:hypothetical protein
VEAVNLRRVTMARNFKETLETLVNERIAKGEDPKDLFDELAREANLVFGHFNLEYELGIFTKEAKTA